MKKTITTLLLVTITLIGTSAFIIKNSTGIQGYTGSPGESTCDNCHTGGSSAASGLTITSVPAFSINANSETEYMADTLYQIKVTMEASGFTHFGFASEVLDNVTGVNSGTIQNPGSGVKFLNSGLKRTAVHSTPKVSAVSTPTTFTYRWKAPSDGNPATIYAIGNAVNNNGSYYGDFVIAPVSLALVAAPTPTVAPDTTGIKEQSRFISQVSVFPNPANDLSNISYFLSQQKNVSIQLLDIRGAVIKQLYEQIDAPGFHTQVLNLQGVSSGVYFIKTSLDRQKVSQKLITVQ